MNEKIDDVGSHIREQIKCMPTTFEQGPPDEYSLLNCDTNIPPALQQLIEKITAGKIVGLNKKKKIDSLCQYVIFSVHGGKYRTKKHVHLSLCVKRKTGSKEVIKWLNSLGHGISYDEVNARFFKVINYFL